jgi:hypothetical protein
MAATSLAAIAFGFTGTAFTAQAETRGFDQQGFSALRVSSGLDVALQVGPGFSIEAEGESAAIDTLDIHMEGATLVLNRTHDWKETLFSWAPDRQQVRLVVSMPAVTAVAAEAGARVELSGEVQAPLRAEASSGASLALHGLDGADVEIIAGSGASVVADGTCSALQAAASSGATLEASMLECADVTADAALGATLAVNGAKTLSLGATGGGSISAHGAGAVTHEAKDVGGRIAIER